MAEKIVFKNIDIPNCHRLDVYRKQGGYKSLEKVLSKWKPDEVIEEVKKSGLRGRGGAGFPAGMKWSFIPKNSDKPKYLCCNADEGEPGTFKDREIIEKDPHEMLEGIAIACYAFGAHTAYIYIRGEFVKGAQILEDAIAEAYRANLLGKNILGKGFDLDIYVHRGAGAYVCGEETGLIESIEGKRGQPRLKPPFPALVGLYQGPTVVNNVETLASVPKIMENGADWYKSFGTEKSCGTKLFCVSGHVKKPGVYELPLGVPMKTLLYDEEYCGGIRDDKKLKAVIPGGSSVPILRAEEIEGVNLDYESLAAAGTMLGSGAVIVMDETTDIPKMVHRLSKFYAHESCGQCTPCREGTAWMEKMLGRIISGKGESDDLDTLLDICDNIEFKTLCPLGDAAVGPIKSAVTKFRAEFEALIKN